MGIPAMLAAYTENDAERLSVAQKPLTGFQASGLAFIEPKILAERIEQKRRNEISFQLVDLRLEADYRLGRLPGAVNMPLKKLPFMAEQALDKKETIVFYGYSRNDQASVNAVILLANKGFENVWLLDGGIAEWQGKIESGA